MATKTCFFYFWFSDDIQTWILESQRSNVGAGFHYESRASSFPKSINFGCVECYSFDWSDICCWQNNAIRPSEKNERDRLFYGLAVFLEKIALFHPS